LNFKYDKYHFSKCNKLVLIGGHWEVNVIFKISFFILMLLSNKLPTDETSQKIEVHGPSKCICCKVGSIENVYHLFRKGEFEVKLWDYFSKYCGISTSRQGTIRDALIRW